MGEVLSLLASPLEGIALEVARWVAGRALVEKTFFEKFFARIHSDPLQSLLFRLCGLL